MKSWVNWRMGLLLVVLGVSTWYFDKYLDWNWWPNVMVAWGTIVLAFFTYRLGKTTREENARLIAENKRISEDNRRSNALGRIREWAKLSIRLITVIDVDKLPKEYSETQYIFDKFSANLQLIRAESIGALADAKSIGGNVETKTNEAVVVIIALSTAFDAAPRKYEEVREKYKNTLTTLTKLIESLSP